MTHSRFAAQALLKAPTMRWLPLVCIIAACVPDSGTAPQQPDAAGVADSAIASAPDAEVSPLDAALVATQEDASATQPQNADAQPDLADAQQQGQPDAQPALTTIAGSLWRTTDFAAFALSDAERAGDGAVVMSANAGTMATDPFGRGNYQGGNYYNGGNYRYAVAVSPAITWARPFDEVVPSFEVDTPAGTWVTIKISARVQGRWTADYVLGVWAYESTTVRRHSVDDQDDADARVATDTLVLTRNADALRMTVILFSESQTVTPRVRALSISAIDTAASPRADPPDRNVWGTILPVPMRSQMIYPDGGEVWCSPTSLTMLLAYWGNVLNNAALTQTVPHTAAMTLDWIYDGNGNWPFNTAHGSAAGGGVLHGFVTRLESFTQIERLIQAQIPVAISISYGRGQLSNSPISSTAGHLIVIRGFARNGDVVSNDPAFGANADVEVTYDRAELEAAWSRSERTTYVLYPRNRVLPADPLGGF